MSPTRAEFHVLLALLDGPRHGYGLMQDVDELSGGRLQIGPGTLYTAIKRLRTARLISETDAAGDERRRCYKLTRKGRGVAEEEAQRLSELVRARAQTRAAAVDVMTAERVYARCCISILARSARSTAARCSQRSARCAARFDGSAAALLDASSLSRHVCAAGA